MPRLLTFALNLPLSSELAIDTISWGDLDRFGTMLHEAYLNKKRINPHIADGTIMEVLYQTALEELGGQFTDFAFDGFGFQVWRSAA